MVPIKKKLSPFFHTLRLMREKYTVSLSAQKPCKNILVYSSDNQSSAGIADRLKGMISTYAYAKANGMDFKIDHSKPFEWSHCLEPNMVNWLLDDRSVSYNLVYARPVYMMDHPRKNIRLGGAQKHIYTNLDLLEHINQTYGTNYSFSELFHELFRPVDALQKEVNAIRTQLGRYIVINFSFHSLLGDSNTSFGGGKLNETQQQDLINDCVRQLYRLHEANPQYEKIMVTSDSQRFINTIQSIEWVYITPGKNGQIFYGRNKDDSSVADNTILRTFLDFLVISHADKVYMAHTGLMYRSQYVLTATRTTGIPYEEISF